MQKYPPPPPPPNKKVPQRFTQKRPRTNPLSSPRSETHSRSETRRKDDGDLLKLKTGEARGGWGGCWGCDLSCDWLPPPLKSWVRRAAELKRRIRQPRRRWNLPRAVIHSPPCLLRHPAGTPASIFLWQHLRVRDAALSHGSGRSAGFHRRIHIGKVSAA